VLVVQVDDVQKVSHVRGPEWHHEVTSNSSNDRDRRPCTVLTVVVHAYGIQPVQTPKLQRYQKLDDNSVDQIDEKGGDERQRD
jgi:hypothetical protein